MLDHVNKSAAWVAIWLPLFTAMMVIMLNRRRS